MEIDKTIRSVLSYYPIFAQIVANIDFKYSTENIPAPSYTDGKTIYYKDSFFKDYNDQERIFIFLHELFHIALRHLNRNIGRDPDLLNFVEDGIINEFLVNDGLPRPKNCVSIPDALDFSADELYMKYLSELSNIKSWMKKYTYHVQINCEINNEQSGINDSKNNLQEMMKINKQVRDELLNEYKEGLKQAADKCFDNTTQSQEVAGEAVGKSKPLVAWKKLLRANLSTPNNSKTRTSFFEVEMDGIIRRELKPDDEKFTSEIIIDSSASMDIYKIRMILRECKNILKSSDIKVGFCDTIFYGFTKIRNDHDIDKLMIKGRGGTNLPLMAESFSKNAKNKIVITDGEGWFPDNHPEVLWVIINFYQPFGLDPKSYDVYGKELKNLRTIFIKEADLVDGNCKKLIKNN